MGEDHGTRAPDYWANLGTVIDVLREDYPRMTISEPDYSIYDARIVFRDHSGYRVAGIEAYRTVLWAIRAQLRLFFATSAIVIQSLYHNDKEGAIYVRWRLTATPWWAVIAGKACPWVYDGLSVYKVNHRGWVYEHLLENNVQTPTAVRPLFERVLSVGSVSVRAKAAGAGAGVHHWYKSQENTRTVRQTESPGVAYETTPCEPYRRVRWPYLRKLVSAGNDPRPPGQVLSDTRLNCKRPVDR